LSGPAAPVFFYRYFLCVASGGLAKFSKAAQPETAVTENPKSFGKYVLQDLIIRTDYSEVFRCRDPDLGMDVAIKVFRYKKKPGRERIYSESFWRERFIAEARTLAGLDHPHIIAVKELAIPDAGAPYFVMPYIAANLIYEIGPDKAKTRKTVAGVVNEIPRALPLPRGVHLLRQILAAGAELHRRNIVHRDLKPGNVLLTRRYGGSVKLCDFGMVKTPDTHGSRAGVWVGTLDYMAPEQRADATRVDARADVYSIGALAYRMLTGRLPVGAFSSPRALVPQSPVGLSELIMAALAPEPAKRPTDAGTMLKRFNEVTATLADSVPAPAGRGVARVVSVVRVQKQ
jgi:serine/threonine-protein kinase